MQEGSAAAGPTAAHRLAGLAQAFPFLQTTLPSLLTGGLFPFCFNLRLQRNLNNRPRQFLKLLKII